MILTKATKLLTTQFHVLCVLLLSHVAQSTENIVLSREVHQESAERDLGNVPYFNLRLYWDKTYRWQETSKETWWCMTCASSTCEKGSKIEIKNCDRNDSRQQWYFDRNKIRSRKNKKMCLHRFGRSIKLSPCTRTKYQKWVGQSKSEPFALQMPGNGDKCVSQHHHPKDDEDIYMESCKLARKANTDKWVVY